MRRSFAVASYALQKENNSTAESTDAMMKMIITAPLLKDGKRRGRVLDDKAPPVVLLSRVIFLFVDDVDVGRDE